MPTQLDDYRLLGRSGLRVSPLSLGTMTWGAPGGWTTSDEEAKQQLDLYVERGGNFVDTANFYGHGGGSERTLGTLIQGRRNQLVLSTKYTMVTRRGDPNNTGNHRKSMVHAVEDSLRRMNTDYIDLLYLHMWDARTPVEEILRAFDDLVRQGKILYAGISDTPAWQISRMQAIADLRGWTPIAALQIPYSLIDRETERELIPMAAEMGIGVCPWSPLGGGVLSGKYSKADLAEAADSISGIPNTRKEIVTLTGKLNERNLTIAEIVGEVAKELGKTSPQVALAWTMLDRAIVSPVLGARTLGQLEDNLGALDVTFDEDQRKRLDEASRIPLGFPHDMIDGNATDMMLGNVKVEKRARVRF